MILLPLPPECWYIFRVSGKASEETFKLRAKELMVLTDDW
jgi:hypothetical protein